MVSPDQTITRCRRNNINTLERNLELAVNHDFKHCHNISCYATEPSSLSYPSCQFKLDPVFFVPLLSLFWIPDISTFTFLWPVHLWFEHRWFKIVSCFFKSMLIAEPQSTWQILLIGAQPIMIHTCCFKVGFYQVFTKCLPQLFCFCKSDVVTRLQPRPLMDMWYRLWMDGWMM